MLMDTLWKILSASDSVTCPLQARYNWVVFHQVRLDSFKYTTVGKGRIYSISIYRHLGGEICMQLLAPSNLRPAWSTLDV